MCKMRELFMRELYGFHESSFEVIYEILTLIQKSNNKHHNDKHLKKLLLSKLVFLFD